MHGTMISKTGIQPEADFPSTASAKDMIHTDSYMFQILVLISFSVFRLGLASLQLARALRSRGQVGALQPGLWRSPLAINGTGQKLCRFDGIAEGLH